ncbi:MAG TPA: LysR substrate-binding domain-containing protein [Burkholderiales bacterium]|nr:LysR substrate-binding domain-containing protein [Burkholderiales bacterium]
MARKASQLPALDFFRGFEAAARHLSFTRAAEELFLTQSAISRQIHALEERLGAKLFTRRNRGLALTEAGREMYRAADIALRTLHEAAERIAPGNTQDMVTVTSSMAFCSLWLIPRLSAFRNTRPDLDVRISANNQVLDLEREQIDVAIRYCPVMAAPPGAIRMFGEEIVVVCSPQLLKDRARPLRSPGDLRRHTLLHFDHAEGSIPWLSWSVWLESARMPELKSAGSLRFSHYDQVIGAALRGQGIALGRRPLVADLLADGALVAPLRQDSVTDRAYFIVRSAAVRSRRDVDDFIAWLIAESAALVRIMDKHKRNRRHARPR